MQQLELNMLTVYEGPVLVDSALVAGCATYRDAVRLCWAQRRRLSLRRAQLAEEAGLYRSHVTDYLSDQENKRELPAKKIDLVERACGNRAISQWLLMQTQRPDAEVLEQQRRFA